MIITYPAMGNLEILAEAAMRELGILTVPPPAVSSGMLQKVEKYVPEDICFPMKKILAGFMEAAVKGADTAILPGGHGPCRFGWFATAMQEVLERCRIPMQILVIEIAGRPDQLWKRLQMAGSVRKMLLRIPDAIRAARALDQLEERMLAHRAEGKNGAASMAFLYKAESLKQVWHIAESMIQNEYANVSVPSDALRIGIAGDIYTINDPDSNMNLQSYLADQGIFTTRSITISQYLDQSLRNLFRQRPVEWEKMVQPLMTKPIGGYAYHTVGHAALWEREAFDGVIQIYPMGCMPEIMVRPLLQNMEIPVLSLVMDNLEWHGGYETRIEAFIDMLRHRKEAVS